MQKIQLSMSRFEGVYPIILFLLGLTLAIFCENIAAFVGSFIGKQDYQDTIQDVISALAYCLWGIQCLIFTNRREFPIFIFNLRGKAALLLGVVLALNCFSFALYFILKLY